ncbi:MAG TPA: hypothetical protein DIC30_00940, partial [Oceanospirillales bacterium]|nr:hypothetical protein [Oceanospirillales bacterium]
MHISSMKDQVKKPKAGSDKRAASSKGATRLKQKEAFKLTSIVSWIPLWVVQSMFVVSLLVGAGFGLQQVRWGWAVEQVEIEGEFRYW